MKKEKILNFFLPISSIFIIITVWFISSVLINSEYILPSIKETVIATALLFADKTFYVSLLSTLFRSVIAFFISFVLAFLFSLLSKSNKNFEKAFRPVLAIIRALPTIAVVLLLYYSASSQVAPIIVTTLVVFPTLYTGIFLALNSIDEKQIEMCKVFNVDEKEIFNKVKLPQIMPSMYAVLGTGLSLNIKLMVAAEVLSQTANCLGYMLNSAKNYFETPKMLALVLVCVVVCVILETVFNLLSKKAGKNL